jgi:hypothetical protein
MGPDDALAITTGVWALAALAALSIAIPQSWRLIRTSMRHDSLWWFRLMSVLLFGALGVAMLRNVAVWADLTFTTSACSARSASAGRSTLASRPGS